MSQPAARPASHASIQAGEGRHPRSVEAFYQLSLLGMVVFGYASLAASGYLGPISLVICGAAILGRFLMAIGVLPTGFSGTGLMIGCLLSILFFLVDAPLITRHLPGAAVHLGLALAGVRLVSARTDRDAFHVQIVALVSLVLGGIVGPGPVFFLCMGGFTLAAVASMVGSEMRTAWKTPGALVGLGKTNLPGRLIVVAGGIGFIILSSALGLFFLLPRPHRESPWQRRDGSNIFSENVGLDDIGTIKQRQKPVLHIRMLSENPPPVIYWRGSALMHFDGRHWYNLPPKAGEETTLGNQPVPVGPSGPSNAKRFHYEVEYQDLVSNLLFLADRPEYVAVRAQKLIRGPGESIRAVRLSSNTRGYVGYSYVPSASDPVVPLTEEERIGYLLLPEPDKRVRPLVDSFTAGASNKLHEALLIADRLRRGYSYTLEMPSRVPRDPIAHFLFVRKKGHCEYFASTMAVMLRLRSIPARVVVGFASPAAPINGWTVVRASDAHAWVEAWLPERGWTTFDPTPPDPGTALSPLARELALIRNTAELMWDRWVARYDLRRQVELAIEMHQSGRRMGNSWMDAAADLATWIEQKKSALNLSPAVMAAAVGTLLLLAAGLRWLMNWLRNRAGLRRLQRGGGVPHDATVLYAEMLELLRKRGIVKSAWLTPREFAQSLPPADAVSTAVREFTDAYNQMRFGGDPKAAPRMIELMNQMRAVPLNSPRGR